MASPGDSLAAAAEGFRLPVEAAGLLLRERQLWALALVPFAFSLAAFAIALALVVAHAGEIHGWATAWMPVLAAAHWYAWLWVGPAKLGLTVLGAILFLAVAGGCLVAAILVASLLASPFHDALALRVERLTARGVVEDTASGALGWIGDAGRALREEARRMVFFLSVTAPLAALGFALPGAHLITAPAIVAFTVFFLPLDYASYALDRRRVSFREKRRWALDRAPLMAGFGAAAFLTCAVPLLNFVAMPLLVVGGTLLAVRHHPVGGAQRASSSFRVR